MNKNKGSSIYFAVAIIAIILGIVLGTSSILITQIRIIRDTGNSVLAIYAADAGIEKTLFEIRKGDVDLNNPSKIEGSLLNGSQYEIFPDDIQTSGTGDCEASYLCIRAIGKYSNVQRAIEVEF